MNKTVVIEANIGTGKSTLLPKLAAELTKQTGMQWTYILEDVDTNEEFQLSLKAFTENPAANRVSFQNYMTDLRHDIGKSIQPGKNVILERSLLSDIVFSFANHQCDAQDDSHIQRIYQALEDYITIDTCVYLKADPRVSYQRMQERGREQEQGTPFEYIQTISEYHDKVLPEVCEQYNVPLLTLEYTRFMPVPRIAKAVMASANIQPMKTKKAA